MKSTHTLRRALFGALLLGSALAISATSDPARVEVSYRDLDLSSAQGAKALYRRIDRAAIHVCARLNGRSLHEKTQFQQCRREAIANAVASVNRTTLTAEHVSRTQKSRAS